MGKLHPSDPTQRLGCTLTCLGINALAQYVDQMRHSLRRGIALIPQMLRGLRGYARIILAKALY